MDQKYSLNVPAQAGPEVLSGSVWKPWLKFLLGFLGWFLLTLPVINFPDFLFGPYVTTNFVLLAVFLLVKRTRLVGVGMASAIAANFLVSTILGTIISPRNLAPVIHPQVYRNHWNFNFPYVSKDIRRGKIPDCFAQAASAGEPTSDPTLGRIAFETLRDGNAEIYLMNADGSGQENLTNNNEHDGLPAWSPDGQQIAFMSARDGNMEIYLMNADGSGQKRLTENPANDYAPTWSPDGKQIAFASDRDGNTEIYTMNVDGSALTNLTRHPAVDSTPAWSPDGRQIAFTSNRDSEVEAYEQSGIYVMNVDGTDVKRLSADSTTGFYPAWSPDGSCLLYQSGLYSTDWVMLLDKKSLQHIKLVHAGSQPNWSPDGRWVLYVVYQGQWNLEIYALDLATLKTSRLTSNTAWDSRPVWEP